MIAATEKVYVNGNVLTVDKTFSRAEAFRTRGDRILAVGTNEEVRSVSGADAEVVDLAGRTVLPGFIDLHGHLALFSGEKLWVDLEGVTSVAEVCDRIGARVESVEAGVPILATPNR